MAQRVISDQEFAQKFRHFFVERRHNSKELARKLQVRQSTISEWLAGKFVPHPRWRAETLAALLLACSRLS